MKNLIISSFVTGLLFISLVSFSQSQLKIGHVNFEEIMLALPESDSAKSILEKETKELQSAYEELTVTYNQLYDEYQKDKLIKTESPLWKYDNAHQVISHPAQLEKIFRLSYRNFHCRLAYFKEIQWRAWFYRTKGNRIRAFIHHFLKRELTTIARGIKRCICKKFKMEKEFYR